MAMNYYRREGVYSIALSYKSMVVNLSVYQEKEKHCKEEVKRLQDEIAELKSKPNYGDVNQFRGLSTASLRIPIMTLKLQYIKYIEIYGVPDDGYFIPELLAEFA
jgi:hypothetical protein